MAEPGPDTPAPVGAEEPRPPAVAPASPGQRHGIAGTAPAPGPIEPIASQTLVPLVPMDLPAGESDDTGLPETLSEPSSSDEVTKATAADAIALYRSARDILWDLD